MKTYLGPYLCLPKTQCFLRKKRQKKVGGLWVLSVQPIKVQCYVYCAKYNQLGKPSTNYEHF